MFKEFNIENFDKSKELLEKKINESQKKINEILKIENKTYKNFARVYQEIGESLNEEVTVIFHLDSVRNSELTQKIYEQCLPLISNYETKLSQNDNIYRALKDIQFNEKILLSDIQNKMLENEIKDFKLCGSHLNEKNKEKLKDINLELSQLSQQFSQNLIDANNAYELIIEDYEDVKEIPKSDLQNASFEENGKTRYKFTLQMPSYISYITYGTSRTKREEIYKAYSTRAPINEILIEKILDLKAKKVNILGFDSYSQYSLERKMAKNENEVIEFLELIGKKSKNKAIEELDEVKALAKEDGINDFASFDMSYYSQKLKKLKYDLDEEFYRPYFEQDSVLKGFFAFLNKIFDISFKEVKTTTWHEKVKVFDLYENNKAFSRLYIDLEARSDKRGGAWMNNWHSSYTNSKNETTMPTAYIVCNFPSSSKNSKSLLRHGDVVTLFHEMGHALHHLLSTVKEPFVSGISGVTWDTVEFPSQFLEYFAYEKDVLKLFAKHYETKEVLSDEAINKIIKAKNFQSSLAALRQVEFALFDFKLYQKNGSTKEQTQELLNEIREEFSPMIPPKYNKFQNGFSHIFSGGYSAGYYSYKWAEVLSADAFYMFINSKNILNKTLAKSFKENILQKGGSYDMDVLFYNLTKNKPNVDSLLKIDGIIS